MVGAFASPSDSHQNDGTEIHGKKIDHFAHKADVLRLLAMKYSGGIYLDIDIFMWVEFMSVTSTFSLPHVLFLFGAREDSKIR